MKSHFILIIILLAIIIDSCYINNNRMPIAYYINKKKYISNFVDETKKLDSCNKRLIYSDLSEKTNLTVLFFSEKGSYDLSSWPNFIIGYTSNNDTIGIIDKDFDGKIKKFDNIIVLPTVWKQYEKDLIHGTFYQYRKRTKRNKIFCSYKIVYRAQIDTSSISKFHK